MFHLIAKFNNGEYEIPHWRMMTNKPIAMEDIPERVRRTARWRMTLEFPPIENPITVSDGMAREIVLILNEHDRKKEKACSSAGSR